VLHADDRGLVSRWSFDARSTDTVLVEDSKGKNHARIAGTARFVADPDALCLDGATSLTISRGKRPAGLPRRSISLEAWVAIDEVVEWGGIIGIIQDNGGFEKGWLLGSRNNTFTFALSTEGADDGDGLLTYLNATEPFEPGSWNHLVGTYDGKEQRIYVNGALAGRSTRQSGEIVYPSDAFFDIAAYHDSNEFYRFRGKLHAVSVFARALTPSEIKARHRAKARTFPAQLRFTNGPRVRLIGPDSVSISWETEERGSGLVSFGLAGAGRELEEKVESNGSRTAHEVRLSGLKPEREYSYRIESIGKGRSRRISRIMTFDTGWADRSGPVSSAPSPFAADSLTPLYESAAERIIARTGSDQGFCLVLGCGDGGRLAWEIAARTRMKVIAVDEDPQRVAAARRAFHEAGIYGVKATARRGDLSRLPFPDYFANLIVSDRTLLTGALPPAPSEVARLLRPCGGKAFVGRTASFAEHCPLPAADTFDRARLEGWLGGVALRAAIVEGDGLFAVIDRGPIEGAGEWTHTYADPANSACSKDTLVRGELELQWFGRPGPRLMIDRHHRNVPPLYKNGRLFVPADDRVICVDAYNGTRLWEAVVPGSRRLGVFLDSSNLVVDSENLYIAHHDRCSTFDAATGTPGPVLAMPQAVSGADDHWSYVARTGDLLVGSGRIQGASYTETSHAADAALWYDNMSIVTSRSLFALDAESGRVKWTYAKNGIIINTTITIGDGSIFFIESHGAAARANTLGRMPGKVFLEEDANYLVSLDMSTGRARFKKKVDLSNMRLIVYLNYADGILLMSGGKYVDKKLWYYFQAMEPLLGKPIWQQNHNSGYDPGGGHGEQNRHPTIVGDTVYTYPFAYRLKTGERLDSYRFDRSGHGCGGISASAHALFWRGGNPLMRDVPGGAARKINHVSRPGCWINIIPAGGMVLIPEASSGCTCSFPLQTSMAYRPATRSGSDD